MSDYLLKELTSLTHGGDPRTITDMKAEDRYSEAKVESVTRHSSGWTISLEHSWSFGISDERNPKGIKPKKGMTCRLYSDSAIGSEFHGVDLDGKEVFWRTPYERFADRIKWLAEHDRRQRESFAAQREELDEQYDSLSAPMQARIDRFRSGRSDFRVRGESYEMFTLVQAEVFAQRAEEAAAAHENEAEIDDWFADGSFEKEIPGQAERPWTDFTPAARWLLWWSQLRGARQRKLMPGLSDDHSGNTFGAAWFYGVRLLLGEDV